MDVTVKGLLLSAVLSPGLSCAWATTAGATTVAVGISASEADVPGVRLHYLTAGHGPAVLLLHGYAETSRMWRPIIPALAETFTVIAPDLPGIGDSSIPADGLDMKTAAFRIHELVKSLHVDKARVVGHDIGLMVAYAYAAQFPAETEKLVVMDAFLPGVGDWGMVYNSPDLWHFRFHGTTPEALVQGRERAYYDYYWNDFAADKTRSIPEAAVRLMPPPTLARDACVPAGPTSPPSSRRPRTSRNGRAGP
jgi:pimeloyl-ACP methyl ester carboxylesterase